MKIVLYFSVFSFSWEGNKGCSVSLCALSQIWTLISTTLKLSWSRGKKNQQPLNKKELREACPGSLCILCPRARAGSGVGRGGDRSFSSPWSCAGPHPLGEKHWQGMGVNILCGTWCWFESKVHFFHHPHFFFLKQVQVAVPFIF